MAVHDMIIRIGAQVSPGFAGNLKQAFASLGGLSGALSSVVGGAIPSAMMAMANSRMGELAELKDLQETFGGSAEYLTKLKYAAGIAGMDIQNLSAKMSRLAALAGQDAGKFEDLGISVYDANGELKDGATIFQSTIDHLSTIENKTARATTAKQLLGRAYADLMPLLEDYNQDTREATVYTQAQIEAAEKYERNLRRIWEAFKAFSFAKLEAPMEAVAELGSEAVKPGGVRGIAEAAYSGAKYMAGQAKETARLGLNMAAYEYGPYAAAYNKFANPTLNSIASIYTALAGGNKTADTMEMGRAAAAVDASGGW